MKFYHSHLTPPDPKQKMDNAGTLLPEDEHNIADGGEFIDDALRMKEQPLEYTYSDESSSSPEAE